LFSQSPKKHSPLGLSKLAPTYQFQKLHEEQIILHKKLDFGIQSNNKDILSKNGGLYKSNFTVHQKRKNSNVDENENNTSQSIIGSGKKFSSKNSTILDFLNKK
jgi:hypothetical protein